MKFTSVAIALLAFAFSARPATVTYTPGTGVLLYPANFFEANSNAIVQAISGAFSGTGSGNASTNAAQGWSASQTFNAPVMFGPTNAVTAIAGKQDLDTDLTDLADGSLTGSKVGTGISADNITTGTLSSNRLPSAVSFTTVDVGTINATAVVGDASGLTGINAMNITTGTLPDARLSANVGLTNAVVLKSGDTMTGDLSVPDEAYGAGWDSSVEVPTKNAVYDQVELRLPKAGGTMGGTLTLSGTAAAGTSNSIAASTKYVDDAVAASPGGGSVATDAIWDASGDLAVGTGPNTSAKVTVGKVGDYLYYDGTNLTWKGARDVWIAESEFLTTVTSGDFAAAGVNGGAGFTGGSSGELGRPGIVTGNTGITSTNGYTAFTTRATGIAGNREHFGEIGIKTSAALPSAQPYVLLIGFQDAVTAAQVDGAFLRLSTFGDVWQAVTVSNSSVTTNDVTLPAAAGTWYDFRVDMASGGSNAVFSSSGVPFATNSVNVPTGASRLYGFGVLAIDDGGLTNYTQTITLDYVRVGGLR